MTDNHKRIFLICPIFILIFNIFGIYKHGWTVILPLFVTQFLWIVFYSNIFDVYKRFPD